MLLPEILRWAAVAASTAAAFRFPHAFGFWSFGPRRPLVLATVGPGRFRQSAPA